MLKEFISNTPINIELTMQELDDILMQDLVLLISEKTSVDVNKDLSEFTLGETKLIVDVVKSAYDKILANTIVDEDTKNLVAALLLNKLFEMLRYSSVSEVFFKIILKKFKPTQIIVALARYIEKIDNLDWITKFLQKNPQLFYNKKKKIRTIALFYSRIYSGGVERILSLIIPIYISMGYRIVLITYEYKPEFEYPLPPLGENFKRVLLNPDVSRIEQLAELEHYFKKESVDLFILHMQGLLPPIFQILIAKLCGIKVIVQFHGYLKHYVSDYQKFFAYRMADALVTLTNMSKDFWKDFGLRAEYIPHPIVIEGAENFHGRDPKKCSNTILYVGRISRADDKNTFAILPILNEVVKVIPNVKLKILGEVYHEEVLEQMEQFIAENNLEHNVEFCGYQKNVGKFYEEADVILSTSPSEGWGLFIVEGKFYELPLVLYELPDAELLRDGKGYIAVPQGDFKAAAKAIVKILTDTEFRCKLSAEAKESLQPFIDYDIAGAWQKIFTDIETNTPIPSHNKNNEHIQNLILNNFFKERIKSQGLEEQVEELTDQVQYLAEQFQKLQPKS